MVNKSLTLTKERVTIRKENYQNLLKENMKISFLREELEKLKEYRIPKELCKRLRAIEESLNSILLFLDGRSILKKRKGRRKPLSKTIREKIKRRDKFTCQNCGKSEGMFEDIKLHIDHIIPICSGGSDDEENLRVLCAGCNLLKKNHIFNELSKTAK